MPATIRRMPPTALLAVALLLAGCVGGRHFSLFAESQAPVLSPDASCEQVVAHINRNTSGCTAWRSTDVAVKSNGIFLTADAMMAVESPRRFRMRVSALNMEVADLGSNDERMWFWMRPPANEPQYVYTCAHCDLPAAQEQLPIPFRPDWLMEVLGVVPIDPATVEMQPNLGDSGEFLLVSNQSAVDGTPVRKIITVNSRTGAVVGHALWAVDETGSRLIAEAKLSDHQRDERTGVSLPHRIELSYPDAKAEMSLTFRSIEVNPTGVSTAMWQPASAGCPCLDLATRRVVTLDQLTTQ